MPSVVDICNRALSHTGTDITIASLTEKSKEARLCARWYESTLEQMLRSYQWGFAQRRVILALIGDGPFGWRFTYRYPTDAMMVHEVFNSNARPAGEQAYNRDMTRADYQVASDGEGGRTLLCNVEDAACRFTSDIEDPNLMPADFSSALELSLAGNIAMPLTANPGLVQMLNQSAMMRMNDAIARDQGEKRGPHAQEAEWTRAHIGCEWHDRDGRGRW